MPNDSYIYGIDLSGKITPVQVRDVIIECFTQAQQEVIEFMEVSTGIKHEEAEKINVDLIIENAFNEVGGDFNKPTKESLIQVIMKLRECAKNTFREPKIIEKRTGEIKQLIDKFDWH